MRDRLLNFLTNHGTLIQPDAVDYILSKKEPIKYIETVLEDIKDPPFMLTVEHLIKVEKVTRKAASNVKDNNQEEVKAPPKIPIKEVKSPEKEIIRPAPPSPKSALKKPSVSPKPAFVPDERPLSDFTKMGTSLKRPKVVCSVQELPHDLKLLSDITGNSTCEGKIGDFKLYFNDRLRKIKKLLKTKREMAATIPISRIKRAEGTFKIIGMVSDLRTTQKGNKIITLEDENASINVLLTKENGLVSDPTVHDEVIGIICSKFKDDRPRANHSLIMAQSIVRPDVPVNKVPNRTETPHHVAFVSDIHVGSDTFLEDELMSFISWLKSKEGEKIEYIVVPGDTVDGIGIYPSQEEELKINDIYGQYEELARMFNMIPKKIKVIAIPGNHDAVRPAEPQPTFPEEVRQLFSENVVFLGNPSYFSIHGVEILAYHGRSMDDFIKALPQLDYRKAKKIMLQMLKKRHLVPIYGGRTPIAPEHSDYLVIDRIPDIFVTGHGHATDYGRYRNVNLINASCWQSQTKFQKMHNFIPDPAKVPIVNLATSEMEIMQFTQK
jgi:DNA polymerase II small subunit